jgi:N-acetylglucosaminyldiphosphoundecaprenol N-acetyl-beta-D-mannosaminyltransferase
MATDPGSMGFTAPAAARPWRQADVLGVPVAVCADVFSAALALQRGGGGQIVTLNAEMTMAARANAELGSAIAAAELVIPDGAGVVWALARQGHRVRRSPGIELARQLLEHAARVGWRVALVGASPAVMETLRQRLPAEIPGLQLALTIHGFQAPDLWPALEAELCQAQPELVLVALGVPRQETWTQRLHRGQPGLWMGVGGSFDVWSGQKRRAPAWMGRLQIEWLYRLIQEPSRWRRMLALPAFVLAVLRNG